MTLTEAAARLGVTPDNLRGAISRGTLKAAKHGRDWWVTEAEVERYQTEHRRSKPRFEPGWTRPADGNYCDHYATGPTDNECPRCGATRTLA